MTGIAAWEQAQEALNAGRPARALKLLAGPVAPPLRVERDFLRAEAWRAQGYFNKAEGLYAGIIRRARASDEALWVDASLGLAAIYRSLGQVPKARVALDRAWAVARRRGGDWRFDLEDALIDRAAGRWRRCLQKLARLLKEARLAGDHGAQSFLLWATGGARRFSGDLAGSQRDFEASLRAGRRAGDPTAQAYALFGLGGVTRIRGRLTDSARHYAAAGRFLAATEDVFGKAYAQCGLANALRQQGKLAQAKGHYLKSHGLYSSLGDAVDLAYVDWGLGKIALQQGDLAQARRRLTLSLRAFDAGREHRGGALARVALAATWHALGQTRRAELLFDQGVRQARKAGLHAHLEVYT